MNKLEFNKDGTIRPMDLTLEGVGALRPIPHEKKIAVVNSYSSSICSNLDIRYMRDSLFKRTESFVPSFAFDGANSSRWMAAPEDQDNWIVADLGKSQKIKQSKVYFVRPTAGQAYILEYSDDCKTWNSCGGHPNLKIQSPHTDSLNIKARYLRIKILQGVKGIWEWNIY